MFFSAAASSENDHGGVNLASNTAAGSLHDAVESGAAIQGIAQMLDLALDVSDTSASVALVPGSVKVLRRLAQLHNEVAGQVLPISLAALLAPETDQGCLVTAHDDAGVRTADERATR